MQLGRYRHYKGNDYQVIGVARHSEDESLLVVYRPLYGEHGNDPKALWVRPYEMFVETVEIDGQTLKRFAYINDSAAPEK